MLNKDIEKYEEQKKDKTNRFKKKKAKGLKKYFVFDVENISGGKYFIRFLIFSVVFVFPTMVIYIDNFYTIILFLCFSYLQSVNAYKRGTSLRKINPIYWGIWGFVVIWFSFFENQVLGITMIPHLMLIFSDANSNLYYNKINELKKELKSIQRKKDIAIKYYNIEGATDLRSEEKRIENEIALCETELHKNLKK